MKLNCNSKGIYKIIHIALKQNLINLEESGKEQLFDHFYSCIRGCIFALQYKNTQVNKDSIFDKFKFPINKKPRIQSVI